MNNSWRYTRKLKYTARFAHTNLFRSRAFRRARFSAIIYFSVISKNPGDDKQTSKQTNDHICVHESQSRANIAFRENLLACMCSLTCRSPGGHLISLRISQCHFSFIVPYLIKKSARFTFFSCECVCFSKINAKNRLDL